MPVFEQDGILELALTLEKESFKADEAGKTSLEWSKAQDSDQTKRFMANLLRAGKNHPRNNAKNHYELLELSLVKSHKNTAILKFILDEFIELKDNLDNPD